MFTTYNSTSYFKTVTTVALVTSVDGANNTIFRNIAYDLKYESSSDDDEKEEGTSRSLEEPLTGLYKSMWAS